MLYDLTPPETTMGRFQQAVANERMRSYLLLLERPISMRYSNNGRLACHQLIRARSRRRSQRGDQRRTATTVQRSVPGTGGDQCRRRDTGETS